jgi:hypothetical protein
MHKESFEFEWDQNDHREKIRPVEKNFDINVTFNGNDFKKIFSEYLYNKCQGSLIPRAQTLMIFRTNVNLAFVDLKKDFDFTFEGIEHTLRIVTFKQDKMDEGKITNLEFNLDSLIGKETSDFQATLIMFRGSDYAFLKDIHLFVNMPLKLVYCKFQVFG